METPKSSFNELIQNSEIPVLVDFYAEWCGPCKAMAPMLKEFADQNTQKVKVIKVDVDKNPMASSKFKVQAVPTLIIFHKGEIIWRQAGVVPNSQLQKIIDNYSATKA